MMIEGMIEDGTLATALWAVVFLFLIPLALGRWRRR